MEDDGEDDEMQDSRKEPNAKPQKRPRSNDNEMRSENNPVILKQIGQIISFIYLFLILFLFNPILQRNDRVLTETVTTKRTDWLHRK